MMVEATQKKIFQLSKTKLLFQYMYINANPAAQKSISVNWFATAGYKFTKHVCRKNIAISTQSSVTWYRSASFLLLSLECGLVPGKRGESGIEISSMASIACWGLPEEAGMLSSQRVTTASPLRFNKHWACSHAYRQHSDSTITCVFASKLQIVMS